MIKLTETVATLLYEAQKIYFHVVCTVIIIMFYSSQFKTLWGAEDKHKFILQQREVHRAKQGVVNSCITHSFLPHPLVIPTAAIQLMTYMNVYFSNSSLCSPTS